MATPKALDRLRSTRARIAKPAAAPPRAAASPRAAAPAAPSPAEARARDWATRLGPRHPLRAIFVGHNPSEHSWARRAPYAHPTNRFFRLLREARLAPAVLCDPPRYARLPAAAGLGFIDLFVARGSDASLVEPDAARRPEWRAAFLRRLCDGTGGVAPAVLCCVSKVVAKKLLVGWEGDFGPAGAAEQWGLDGLEGCEVWVLPSTSGRAGMTWEARLGPFRELKERLDELGEWQNHEEEEDA